MGFALWKISPDSYNNILHRCIEYSMKGEGQPEKPAECAPLPSYANAVTIEFVRATPVYEWRRESMAWFVSKLNSMGGCLRSSGTVCRSSIFYTTFPCCLAAFARNAPRCYRYMLNVERCSFSSTWFKYKIWSFAVVVVVSHIRSSPKILPVVTNQAQKRVPGGKINK